jgi:hypothetical protein
VRPLGGENRCAAKRREIRISIPREPLSLCATMCSILLAWQSYAASLKGIAPGASGRSRRGAISSALPPKWGSTAKSTFLELGARRCLVISIAGVAVAMGTAAAATPAARLLNGADSARSAAPR